MAGDAVIRSTIARDASLSVLGAYGIGYRVATGLGIFVTGFAIAWQPYLYRADARSVRPRARRTAPALVITLGWGAVVLTLLAREIVAIVAGPDYASAVEGIGPLTGGMVAFGLFMLLGALSGASGATTRVGLIALLGAAAQVAGALVLVGRFGLIGAAYASLVGYVVAAVVLALATRAIVLDRAGALLIAVSVVTALGLAAAMSIGDTPLVVRLSVTAVATVIGAVGLMLARSETPSAPA
jgi:O-antigen/teichoic acid export membrane protein